MFQNVMKFWESTKVSKYLTFKYFEVSASPVLREAPSTNTIYIISLLYLIPTNPYIQ